MPRSLSVRLDYITPIKSSLLRNGFPSQKILAEELGLSQSTISNFLNGKPVDYINFLEICQRLAYDWREVAFLDNEPETNPTLINWKIFINSCPQNPNFALKLDEELTAVGNQVFLGDRHNSIAQYLNVCDYWLLLLSQTSVVSEILLEELRLVKDIGNLNNSTIAIFPICLDLSPKTHFSFDLLGYLQDIQPWHWRSLDNIKTLASELVEVLKTGRRQLPKDRQLALNWNSIIPQELTVNSLPLPAAAPELPEGQVELDSNFYIHRPPIEERCYQTITQPGALIRIKAPRQMGKTSLMARILAYSEKQGHLTVPLTFQLANQRIFRNSDTFLQWFCASVSFELGLLDSEELAKYAQLAEIIGSNQSCKAYFEQYLLPNISQPLTLGLDEVDRVFESPEIADDFFGLLRSLHEEAKRRDLWKKLRLIVVHSTEVYIPLDVNKSPFNVGLPIELSEFNSQQVQELARRYGLTWSLAEVEQLMALVGGHPYLVRLAMYHIASGDLNLSQLLAKASIETGIYHDHLRRLMWNLEQHLDLMEAMRDVVSEEKSVRLPSELGFKLNSMGLIKFAGNDCLPRCNLYRQYFGDIFMSNG